MSDPPGPLMRPQFAALFSISPAARHSPPARSGPLPALRSVKVLDQLRERIRYLHYSRRTEEAYVHWVRAFIRFHGLRHPTELGGADIERFLSWLVNERSVAGSTHRQALSALLFFYGKVLGADLPWMADIGRPRIQRRLPVVLSRDEVAKTLTLMSGEHRLLAHLLYGTGLRITEALQLRIKDLDFEHQAIVVREGKGNKDRVVMLPQAIVPALREQLACVRPRAWCAATTCTTRRFSAPSSVPSLRPGFRSRPRRTPCDTPSRHTCCRLAMTSARCRNCLGTRTWRPR
jgi:integrase